MDFQDNPKPVQLTKMPLHPFPCSHERGREPPSNHSGLSPIMGRVELNDGALFTSLEPKSFPLAASFVGGAPIPDEGQLIQPQLSVQKPVSIHSNQPVSCRELPDPHAFRQSAYLRPTEDSKPLNAFFQCQCVTQYVHEGRVTRAAIENCWTAMNDNIDWAYQFFKAEDWDVLSEDHRHLLDEGCKKAIAGFQTVFMEHSNRLFPSTAGQLETARHGQ